MDKLKKEVKLSESFEINNEKTKNTVYILKLLDNIKPIFYNNNIKRNKGTDT